MNLTCLKTDNVPAVQHLVSVIQAQMRSTTSPMFNTCITIVASLISWAAIKAGAGSQQGIMNRLLISRGGKYAVRLGVHMPCVQISGSYSSTRRKGSV